MCGWKGGLLWPILRLGEWPAVACAVPTCCVETCNAEVLGPFDEGRGIIMG